MGKTGKSVKRISYAEAQSIVMSYSENGIYLNNLIGKYMSKIGENIDYLEFYQKINCGRIIFGVAKKILQSRERSLEKKTSEVEKVKQLELFR